MSALPPIATAKADSRKRSCLLYPRKRTCAVQLAYVCFGPEADITTFDQLINWMSIALAVLRRIPGAYAFASCGLDLHQGGGGAGCYGFPDFGGG